MEPFSQDQDSSHSDDLFSLQTCQHIFHPNCLKQYLQVQVKDNKLPLVCPDPECKQEISDQDLRTLMSDAEYQKYQTYGINRALSLQGDVSWCPTPDCKFAFVFQPGDAVLDCPLCKKKYCLNCRVLYHEGLSCQ